MWEDGWGRGDKLAQALAHCNIGDHTGNALRGANRAAKNTGFMSAGPSPYKVKAPGLDGKQVEVQVFLPHEMYAPLLKQTQNVTRPWCLSRDDLMKDTGVGKLLRDWGNHMDVNIVDLGALESVAIFGLHADGATYTTTNCARGVKSVLVASVNVISAAEIQARSTRDMLFVIAKNKKCNCGCSGYHT